MHNLWRQKSVTLLHHAPSWQALQDARKIEDIILMWTVNFGLNLNETTEEGPRSISVLSLIRDETRLQLVRFLSTAPMSLVNPTPATPLWLKLQE